MGFKQEKFKKLIDHKSGYTWSKDQELDKAEPGSVRVLTVTNIQEKLDLSSELYLKDVKEKDRFEKSVSKNWTISVSSNGNRKRIGNAIFINDDTDYLFASFLTAFKPKADANITAEYFYQWFTSHLVQERITSVSEGTTGLGNLDIRYLRNMDVKYPDNDQEQKSIAIILHKVDANILATENCIKAADKLVTSLKQNLLTGKLKADGIWRNENEMNNGFLSNAPMKGLQKYYSYKIPTTWEIVPLKKIVNLVYGSPLSENNRNGGDYPVYGSNGIVGFHDSYTAKGPGIIIGRKGTAGAINWSNKDFNPIDTTYYVIADESNIDLRFIYFSLQLLNLDKLNAATGVPGLNRRDALSLYVPIPKNKKEQILIRDKIDSIVNEVVIKEDKIKTLQRLKKSLVQNLLTGKVRVDVKKIEEQNLS